jgi:hypothetical protein
MMTISEFKDCLTSLALSQTEAARLLSVSPRTVRRWAEIPHQIPGPVEQALRAWLHLGRLGLAWRPDVVAVGEEDIAKQIERYREHAIELDSLLQRVKARGGPANSWNIDLKRCQAQLGPLRVSFHRLRNGGFSPSFYSGPLHETTLLEDAYFCIAEAIASEGSEF